MSELSLIPQSEFARVREEGLDVIADMCRLNALTAVKRAGSGHLGSSFSAMDIVVFLLYEQLNVAQLGFDNPDRDIYFSSKGHDVLRSSSGYGEPAGWTVIPTYARRASKPTPARSAWASPRGEASPGPSGSWAGAGAWW